jgi:thiamine-phosphate pyrophosphorylase
MKSLSECRLYAFVDTAYLHGRDPALIAQQLCAGGADLIQLRAKHSTETEILEMARAIAPVTKRAGVRLVINDYLSVAQEVEAELCHLGQEDFFDAGHQHVLELKGGKVEIGLSTHAPEQAARAVAAGAAYVAIGPVYATGTKPGARPVTLDYVRWAAENIKIPWFAIGGINLGNIDEVLAAGATRICVVSGILNAADVARECRKYRERLG